VAFPPPKDDKTKPRKDMSRFNKDAIAEDTERSMQGRPQRFGAAMDDDTGDGPPSDGAPHVEQAQTTQPPKPPEEMGGPDPQQPGLEEGMPGEPGASETREMAESDVDRMPNTPEAHHGLMKKHHGSMHDLHKRISALEAKSGGQGHEPSAGSGPQPAMGGDEDGY